MQYGQLETQVSQKGELKYCTIRVMMNGVADGAPVLAAPSRWCPAPSLHSQAGGQESCVALLQAA